jgi:beta-xylosidase
VDTAPPTRQAAKVGDGAPPGNLTVGEVLRAWISRLARRSQRAAAPPAHPGDFADPFVLHVEGTYYAYATQAGGHDVQVMRSTDLTTWEHLGDALGGLPPWAGSGRTWAPVVLRRGDGYVLYYVVREPQSDRQAISVARAARPEGPFVDASAGPLVFQPDRGGSIDPSPFVDRDGTAYLLWKSDDNALKRPSSLWIQALAADGMSLTGRPTALLAHDRSWERPLVEAPAMVLARGRYYLFYSANWWESAGYSVGYATSRSVTGPFRKATRARPWLRSGLAASGPGGQEFFVDGDGHLRMAYHGWTPDSVGYDGGGARSLRIARVGFAGARPWVRR